MTDQNLTTKNLAASGTLNAGRTRIRSIYNGALAGTVELKDGGAGGETKFKLTMIAGMTVDLPGSIAFETDCYADLTTTTLVMFVY
jgi:hypothetical protein